MYPCPYCDPFPQVRGLFTGMERLLDCPEAPNHRHFCRLPCIKKMSLAHDPPMPPPSLISASCSASAYSGTSGSCAPSLPNLNLHRSAMRPPIPFQVMQPCHAPSKRHNCVMPPSKRCNHTTMCLVLLWTVLSVSSLSSLTSLSTSWLFFYCPTNHLLKW